MQRNDEQYINYLVDTYKKTAKQSDCQKLIDAFEPFLNKYSTMLCGYGSIDTSNADTRKFLRLFMAPKDRETERSLSKACAKYIHYLRKIFSDFTMNDIYDEVLVYFLQALKKYKPIIANNNIKKGRISFAHYIQVSMRFKVKDLVRVKSRDAMTSDIVQYDELVYHPSENQNNGSGSWSSIDLNWIHGFTTGDMFKRLTELERYLVWIKYESHPDCKVLSNRQISETTGLHKKTVDYKLKNVKSVLTEFI